METLKEQYQEIENRINTLAKQKIGKSPNDALRIDNEMNVLKDERYNLYVEIQKQKGIRYNTNKEISYSYKCISCLWLYTSKLSPDQIQENNIKCTECNGSLIEV